MGESESESEFRREMESYDSREEQGDEQTKFRKEESRVRNIFQRQGERGFPRRIREQRVKGNSRGDRNKTAEIK